jgi:hypothetical protein
MELLRSISYPYIREMYNSYGNQLSTFITTILLIIVALLSNYIFLDSEVQKVPRVPTV